MYLILCKDIKDKKIKILVHYSEKLFLYNNEILNKKKI